MGVWFSLFPIPLVISLSFLAHLASSAWGLQDSPSKVRTTHPAHPVLAWIVYENLTCPCIQGVSEIASYPLKTTIGVHCCLFKVTLSTFHVVWWWLKGSAWKQEAQLSASFILKGFQPTYFTLQKRNSIFFNFGLFWVLCTSLLNAAIWRTCTGEKNSTNMSLSRLVLQHGEVSGRQLLPGTVPVI